MFTTDTLKTIDPSLCVYSDTDLLHEVETICLIEHPRKNAIVFVKNKKYYDKLLAHTADGNIDKTIGIVFQKSFLEKINGINKLEFLKQFKFYATVESVDLALPRFSKLFFDEFSKKGNDLIDGRKTSTARVHPSCRIAEGVFLGEGVEIAADVTIHSGCVILSHSKIGERTILYPNVVVYRNVSIGKDCIIYSNSSIGSDGFGYSFHQGTHLKIWHWGGVIVEDSVEIGSNTSVDQGTFSPTVIGQGSKIDNQIQIAHNCRLGKGVVICGQSGLAGSVTLGDYVVMGGAVNIAPDLVVGNYAQIAGMAGVTSDIPEKGVFGGHPARPINEWLRSSVVLNRLSIKRNGNLKKE